MADQYNLSDAHRPTLEPGKYEVHISWHVDIDKTRATVDPPEIVTFQVDSERFWLNPSEIDSVYPPEGSTGDYNDDPPHVVLSRDTLPWERFAKKGSNEQPWLALLLFTEEEALQRPLKTITLQSYKDTLASYTPKVDVELKVGEDKESVQVIELPHDVPHGVLPRWHDLSSLCHARTALKDNKVENTTAVVVSKRLPSPGRNTAHLVMLEHRYSGEEFPLPNAGTCLLISLKSWTFTCQAASDSQGNESLGALLNGLKPGWLQLNSPGRTPSSYERGGFVPLPHRFRTGEYGASWYAGPLSCGIPIFKKQDAAEIVKLPADCADDLLWYDEHIGMLNVTYAAAWELGRLLAVQNRTIFTLLHKWRRQQIHCHHTTHAGAHGGDCCHIPQIQCASAERAPEAPPELKDWLNGLRRLQGIPYRYLLPDERLLPSESIRFFAIDQHYIDALLDGALSSVRAPNHCPDRCRQGELELLAGKHPEIVMGFLIRSAAVAGFPGLEATAATGRSMTEVRAYPSLRLSPSIRMFMFEGIFERVTLGQRADTIHLSVKDAKIGWSNREKRALETNRQSGSVVANAMLPSRSDELVINLTA